MSNLTSFWEICGARFFRPISLPMFRLRASLPIVLFGMVMPVNQVFQMTLEFSIIHRCSASLAKYYAAASPTNPTPVRIPSGKRITSN